MRTTPRSLRAGALATAVTSAMLLTACASAGEDAPVETSDPPSASQAPVNSDASADATDVGSSDAPEHMSGESAHSQQPHDGHADTGPAPTAQQQANGVPVIEIDMLEFAYDPPSIELQAGEATTLRLTNRGEIEHEAMLGDAHMQQEFAASDNHGDHGGDGHHGDMMAVTLAPGETADLNVVIDEPGTWYLGCHLPGHYDAGMQATVTVVE